MQVVQHLVVISALLVGLALSACASGGTPGDGDCTGDFDITVSAGTTPVFEWEGGAAGLAVAHFPEGSERTWVLSMLTEAFEAPVTYGTVPANAVEADGEAAALESGVEYSVTITLADGANASCALFTP